MELDETPLPSRLPISIDIEVYNNCSNLHFEITSIKRTIYIDANINKTFIQEGEKCHILVDVDSPNVPASFHIGLGESYFTESGVHQHLWYTVDNRNLTHKINFVHFGHAQIESSLDGTTFLLQKQIPYMITYNVQLMRVTLDRNEGYQAIASVSKSNLEKIRSRGIPGIIFEWNFLPIGIQKKIHREPIMNSVSRLLAMFGCFFVFARAIDLLAFRSTTLFPYHKM
ncbi:endoplasmic reticulum-Golgi intermediate compartment protein 3-like [Histomonas meleagridis]|uniref:endoplasmic reticulum-Golgi intermediate compartment protein 3-like n=1 Tax=Histomonas meleagridis TaxID=135588 RepID=UPI003559FA0E|nr:endoplasmic reticulum-Golgi intermediate compartment protein 3-like [Histomonas meleagridis]KAH0804491.1 endoplasmic reticulum-Golgi intermediate compartment protein 3-like [Histomonas meleagridis]